MPAVTARLGVAMSGLAVFWAVQASSGSFARAGAATGAFAVADALAGPQIGRLIDRHGQRRVVPFSTAAFVVAAVVLIAACTRSPSPWLQIAVAAGAGATLPPVGALSAARWRTVTARRPAGISACRAGTSACRSGTSACPAGTSARPAGTSACPAGYSACRAGTSACPAGGSPSGAALLPAALSVDGAANDLAFLAGPVLVTTLSAGVTPWAGLALATILVAAGITGLLTARSTEPPPAGRSRGLLIDRRLLNHRFVVLFAANTAMGLFFGGIGVVITAFAFAHHAGALAGPITAVSGVVSLAAGLTYGSLAAAPSRTIRAVASSPSRAVGTAASSPPRTMRAVPSSPLRTVRAVASSPLRIMRVAALTITAGCAVLALTPNVPAMFAGYALVGGCVALVLIPGAVLLQEATVPEVYTQAMTWINSASAAGIAIAAPSVGQVVQSAGWPVGFLLLAGLTATLPLTLMTYEWGTARRTK
ncbi:MFS transporter [Actinoplanes sp. NPDC023714]|uniref:MFS transporter n=1 Tax=Actinoplanes sp. NPDC023714 TaxID=3154322 RepID=UPI00340BA388